MARTYTMAIIDRDGRTCDPREILRQIGKWNLLAVSGGKWHPIKNSDSEPIGAWLPVNGSRAVEVTLDYDDTYRVRRVRRIVKGPNRHYGIVEHEWTGVYCDQVGDAAYTASCWR